MTFPHGYATIKHHLIGIMNDPVDDAERLADRTMDKFISTFPEYCEKYHLGITIGIACAPKHGNGLYELLKKADEALYVGKRKGKKRVTVAE